MVIKGEARLRRLGDVISGGKGMGRIGEVLILRVVDAGRANVAD